MFRSISRVTTAIRQTSTPWVAFRSPLHVRWISDTLRSKLDTDVKSKPVVLFMKGTPEQPMCGFSRATVQIMQVQGVDFTEKVNTFNVLEDEELRQGIKEYSEWPTIPQVYINGDFVGGCDILLNMHQSGDLEDLLVKEGVIPAEEEVTKQE